MLYYILIFTIFILLFLVIGKFCVKNYFGKDQCFYDDGYEVFPHLKTIADNHKVIEKEFLADSGYKIFDWPETYLAPEKDDEWKVVPLYGFGIWNNLYSDKFPETIKLLKQIPGLRTAIFSSLGPGTKLKKHQGWASLANEVLRCHMGIVVPKGRSGVEVEDEFRQVTCGDWLVFDDSKTHIGVNDTDKIRTVLLLDIDRPWWIKKGKSTIKDTPELESFIQRFTN